MQPYERKLVQAIQAEGAPVRLHICGKTRRIYAGMGAVGAEIVDLDFMNPMDEARAMMGSHQVLLGNVDPVRVMYGRTVSASSRSSTSSPTADTPGAGWKVTAQVPEIFFVVPSRLTDRS